MNACEKIVIAQSIQQANALNALVSERIYQDQKWGTIQDRPRETGTYLTLMRKLLTEAEIAFAESAGDESALDELRKVAAVGLACFEQHGVPVRAGIINQAAPEQKVLVDVLDWLSNKQPQPKSFPKVGEFWPEQGGYLGAIMRGKDTPDYCLIVSEKEHEFTDEWGQQGKTINTNEWDGFANTKLMISLGDYPAAKKCLEISAHGFNDWFIGSRREMHALYANISELFDKDPWYWTSTQYSAYYACCQDFENGTQSYDDEPTWLRVRPVRRLFI